MTTVILTTKTGLITCAILMKGTRKQIRKGYHGKCYVHFPYPKKTTPTFAQRQIVATFTG
jgi:hypothetical protein